MIKEIRDPEYEKVVEKAIALLGTVVLATIVVCLWKIGVTVLSF